MAIQIQGNAGTVAEVDGTTFRAIRVTTRPVDYGALGIYSLSLQTGVMAAGLAANAEIFQFRWTDATRLCAIWDIECDGAGNAGTAFAAGVTKFEAVIARGWTVDGSGGTAATLTTNNAKLRTSMGTTLVGAIRMSSTAALTAGTKTLDTQGIGGCVQSVPATAGASVPAQRLFRADIGSMPLVLAANEGFIVRATVPATGTWTSGITVRWAEVAAY